MRKVAATRQNISRVSERRRLIRILRVLVSVLAKRKNGTRRTERYTKSMIEHGLMAVMTAHASLPCYQKECNEYGETPIATVSKELISDLLKDDLGFEGVVVTDGLSWAVPAEIMLNSR